MPKRFCQCRGCTSCQAKTGVHGKLFDADATGTLKCPPCQAEATVRRNARPSSSARGLGWAFSERKRKDPNYQAAATCQCTGCPQHQGLCGKPFTRKNPKTGGHVTPRSQGGGDGPIRAVCRSCNSADGGRLAHRH